MGGVTLIGTWGCQVQVEARAGSSRESSGVAAGNAGLGAGRKGILSALACLVGSLPTRLDLVFLPQLGYRLNVMSGLGPFSGCLGPVETSKYTVKAESTLSKKP